MPKRLLTQEEKLQLNISKENQLKTVNEKFSWLFILKSMIWGVLFATWIYFLDEYTITWIARFGIGIIPILIWINFSNFKSDKKRAMNTLDLIKNVEDQGGIYTQRYFCKKAILFENEEEEFFLYAFEIGDKQILFWSADYEEIAFLPNSEIEIFEDKRLVMIFGYRFKTSGAVFQPIKILLQGNSDLKIDFDLHNQILPFSVNEYLEKIR